MKQLIIFIALKSAEIVGVVFVPWWVGGNKWWINILCEKPTNIFIQWFDGAFALALISMVLCILYGVFYAIGRFVQLNWHWAGNLAKR